MIIITIKAKVCNDVSDCLRSIMDKRKGCLHTLLQRLPTELANAKTGHEALVTLQATLELCNGLLSCDAVPRLVVNYTGSAVMQNVSTDTSGRGGGAGVLLRTMAITPADLAVYVAWQHSTTEEVTDKVVENSTEQSTAKDFTTFDHSLMEDGKGTLEKKACAEDAHATFTDGVSTDNNTLTGNNSILPSSGVVSTAMNSANIDEMKVNSSKTGFTELSKKHPLLLLESVVVDVCYNEAVTEQLYNDVMELIAVLQGASGTAPSKVTDLSDTAAIGLGGGCVKQQYEERLINCPLTDIDEPPELWLHLPPSQYGGSNTTGGNATQTTGESSSTKQDSGPDMVAVSLMQSLQDCTVSDYNLEASVQKVLRGHQAGTSPQKTTPLSKGPAKFKSHPVPLRPGGRGMRPFGTYTVLCRYYLWGLPFQ